MALCTQAFGVVVASLAHPICAHRFVRRYHYARQSRRKQKNLRQKNQNRRVPIFLPQMFLHWIAAGEPSRTGSSSLFRVVCWKENKIAKGCSCAGMVRVSNFTTATEGQP
jgi:hypothetical protein